MPAAADVVGGVGDCDPVAAVASRNGRGLVVPADPAGVFDDDDDGAGIPIPNLILRW